MSDHIPDVNKLVSDTPRTDMMEQHAPVGIRRNSAFEQASDFSRQLERELNAANDRIRLLIAERDTARMQADQKYNLREEFRELLGTDDVERGVAVVREMKQRIKRLEEVGDEVVINYVNSLSAFEMWRKAKEAKP